MEIKSIKWRVYSELKEFFLESVIKMRGIKL